MRAYYLSAGNFPSIAANTIQIAKMCCAFSRWLPEMRMVALTGTEALFEGAPPDLQALYGLSRPLEVDYLPLLPGRGHGLFEHDYRPPAWFYHLAAQYASWQGAELVVTRRPETALTAIALGIDTIFESHAPWSYFPHVHPHTARFASPHLKAVVVVADSLARDHMAAGLPGDRIVVEQDGVDLGQYPEGADRQALRASLGWDDRFTVVYTGHLLAERGMETAFAAARLVPEARFVFAGGWPEDVARCRESARGIDNAEFTGFLDHPRVAAHQMAADALLMQYSLDAHHADRCSPLKLFEYMGAARPIVATDMPCLRFLMRHGENCLLAPSGDAEALASAVRALMADREMGERLARTARAEVAHYDWELRAGRILDLALKEER